MSLGSPKSCLLGLPLTLFLTPLGCSSAPPIPDTGNGELHQGTFVYGCASSSDLHCTTTTTPATTTTTTAALPPGIALGADFDLRFDATSSAAQTSLSPNVDYFSVDATGRFHASRAGYGVVLVTEPSGAVVDFVNLRVKTIASLAIRGVDAASSLHPNETRALAASPFDATGQPLAGTLMLEWESSATQVVTVTMTEADRRQGTATLRAVAPGTARLRVVAGASTSTVSVRVGGS